MSLTDSSSDGEFEAVIAAAAYAITSLEEQEAMKKERSVKFAGESFRKTKSRNDETKVKLTSFRGSFKQWFTDQEEKDEEKPGGSKRFESGKEMKPVPSKAPSTKYTPTTSFGDRPPDRYTTYQSKAEADAAAWEKGQMAKIIDRYNKMMAMIVEWENDKKAKAKKRLEQAQNESEQRRARDLQRYQDEISRIEKVASEARALAEERKRNDEMKARAKADKIRATGKIPRACCSCC